MFKNNSLVLTGVDQLAGHSQSHKVRGCQFDSRLGHMPGLQAQSLIGLPARGNQSMFLLHIGVSLPPFIPSLPSP